MSISLHTSLGDLRIGLFCEDCPETSLNFLRLAASGAYNATKFHRNIKGFIVQGGDTTTGNGKGGQTATGEPLVDEYVPNLVHDKRGIVSMANSGKGTAKSQFFITYAAHPNLDSKFVVFGQVLDGFDTLEKMENAPVNDKNRPISDICIEAITIHENPFALRGEA
eukprot:ANDGO_07509.mRNA.1 Peptidyl-prolyl cis-trans isomerase-like 3